MRRQGSGSKNKAYPLKPKLSSNKAVIAAAVFILAMLASLNGTFAETIGENVVSAKILRSEQDGREKEELKELLDETLDRIDLEAWDDYLNGAGEELLQFGDADFSGAAELIRELSDQGFNTEADSVFEMTIAAFLSQLAQNAPFIGAILAISVFGGAAGMLFKGDGMNSPVRFVLSSCAVLSTTAVFSMLASEARAAVGAIGGFCELCAPPLSILLTACGCTEASVLLTPKLSLLASGISSLISGAVMPALLVSGILCMLAGISEKLKLFGAIKLIHKTVKWAMGLAAVIFGAVILIGGASAAAMDGAAFRSAKYAVDRMLPFGGSMVTGTVETVASVALIAKNAVGIGGILISVLIASSPLLKLAGGVFAFRIGAAVCEAFSCDGRVAAMLSGIGDTLSSVFAVCVCSAAMIVLTLGAIISAGMAFF